MPFRGPFAQDRRRRKRQLLNTSVCVLTEAGRIEALGINISDVGMCLFTVANLPINAQIEIEFLPPGRTDRVRIGGMIRYRALYLYGIEFADETDSHSDLRADDRFSSDATT